MFQVSNWFINARVRLWKPMVEEMYQQETKEEETDQEEEEQQQEKQAQIPMHNKITNMATSATTTTALSSVRSEFNAKERDPSNNIINYRQYALGNQLVMLQSDDTTTASTSNQYFTAVDAVDLVASSNATVSNTAAFGSQPAGDVSLTLGLRHSENVPRKPAQFQLRDFGAY